MVAVTVEDAGVCVAACVHCHQADCRAGFTRMRTQGETIPRSILIHSGYKSSVHFHKTQKISCPSCFLRPAHDISLEEFDDEDLSEITDDCGIGLNYDSDPYEKVSHLFILSDFTFLVPFRGSVV